MTEAEFQEMEEIFKEQQRKIQSSLEYADELLTRLNIKHLLVPKGTNGADMYNVSR
jgi:hypothetical protein